MVGLRERLKRSTNYQKITLDRDEIVEKLRTVASYSKSVAHSNDELFLLHLGM
jgi:hypothetical protein